VFFAPFYRLLYPDAGQTDEEAFQHFLSVGIAGNLRPHPLFDPAHYLKENTDVALSQTPAILHYLRYGGREWRAFSPLVELHAYQQAYAVDVALTRSGSALEDFATADARPLGVVFFDPDHYRAGSPDAADLPFNRALEHFLTVGLAEVRDPHPLIEIGRLARRAGHGENLARFEALFADENSLRHVPTHALVDPAFYMDAHPSVTTHPVIHFLRYGRQGTELTPHPLFDPAFYCRTYGTANSVAAVVRYVRGGMDATSPNPFFDPAHYRQRHAKALGDTGSALEHYMAHGHRPTFDPSPRFAQRYYLTRHPDAVASGEPALVHFLTKGREKGYAARPPAPHLDTARSLSRSELIERIRANAGRLVQPPEVSVIIPVYGELDTTLRCLHSILERRERTPFEIVMADDASPDGSGAELAAALDGLPGIRVLRNETNLGFLRSCNRAAATAEGTHVLFLNNDTQVLGGWLDELMGTLDDIPEAGLVGSKLVYPDGRLQEAGGVVWSDGSAANYGRLDDPEAPAFNYLRDVDYVSGAAILIRADAWRAVGGFSEAFAPAYYEDTDLAMKLRAHGWRVLYQPLSLVVHEEGVSSGTDLSTGVKRHQVINRETFRSTWSETLADFGRSGDLSRHTVDRRAKGRILFYDAEVPVPDRDSGSVTVFHYLRILARLGYRVTFLADNVQRYGAYGQALQRFGIEVLCTPYIENAKTYVFAHGGDYDLIVLSRAPVGGRLVPGLKAAFPTVPVVFDTVDLHHVRLMRKFEQSQVAADLAAALEMKHLELAAIAAADSTLLVSEEEAAIVRAEIGPFPHTVVPLIYTPYVRRNGFSQRRDVAFVGGFRHTPNVDAAIFLAEEIWPRVRNEPGMEGARLHIVGSLMPPEVKALSSDDVLTVGFVQDLEAYFESIRVSVAPLRYGAGVKGKIGNSLRMGVPVVTTAVGAEGMHLRDGEHVLLSRNEQEFAANVARLYRDETLWDTLSRQGQAFAEEKFGIAAASRTLDVMVRSLIRQA
jgi:GT2 family glycosyltransferase